MSNAVAEKPKFSDAIQSTDYQNMINSAISDPNKASRFVAGITSAVATNPDLQACLSSTILSGALLGESLNLSPSPQLGQYYLVPFNDRKNKRKVATFILGYKGYLQLAIRSGEYKSINVKPVKKGELKSFNPFTEEMEIEPILDSIRRDTTETIGYYGEFVLINGFRKAMYWSKDQMEAHAVRYSPGYMRKSGYTFWEKDFDAMGCKTIIRQLLSSGYAPLSVDMRSALEADDKATDVVDGKIQYYEQEEPTNDIDFIDEQTVKAEEQPSEVVGEEISLADI